MGSMDADGKLIETGLNPQRRVSPNDISYLSNDPIHVES